MDKSFREAALEAFKKSAMATAREREETDDGEPDATDAKDVVAAQEESAEEQKPSPRGEDVRAAVQIAAVADEKHPGTEVRGKGTAGGRKHPPTKSGNLDDVRRAAVSAAKRSASVAGQQPSSHLPAKGSSSTGIRGLPASAVDSKTASRRHAATSTAGHGKAASSLPLIISLLLNLVLIGFVIGLMAMVNGLRESMTRQFNTQADLLRNIGKDVKLNGAFGRYKGGVYWDAAKKEAVYVRLRYNEDGSLAETTRVPVKISE